MGAGLGEGAGNGRARTRNSQFFDFFDQGLRALLEDRYARVPEGRMMPVRQAAPRRLVRIVVADHGPPGSQGIGPDAGCIEGMVHVFHRLADLPRSLRPDVGNESVPAPSGIKRWPAPPSCQYHCLVPDFQLAFAPSMRSIDRAEWDALASRYDSPFLGWGFLALLEESKSVSPERGWTPLHLLLRRGSRLVAAAPVYVKTSSGGEFVWDFEFARVAEANGITWYPKLVGMIPVTPSPAWRVMVAEGEDEEALVGSVLEILIDAAYSNQLGGFHVLWPAPDAAELIGRLRGTDRLAGTRGRRSRGSAAGAPGPEGLVAWEHQAFVWNDEGYGDFAGYLAAFSKNMRRNVLRERSGLDAGRIERRIIEAREAAGTPGLLGRMADYYETTNDRFGPWAARWLERDFFLRLPEFMPEGWMLGAAFAEGDKEPIALSFLMRGAKSIWGRYWGCARFEAGLHFELCYYLPIEWALRNGIVRFDPGMGSEHKARRGFRSVLAPSFHAICDPRMAKAFSQAVAEANRSEMAEIAALNADLPFKAIAKESS